MLSGRRGIGLKLRKQSSGYVGTQFFPGEPLEKVAHGFRNEGLQALTIEDNHFDLSISLDVMEHIPEPKAAFMEIWSDLKRGGSIASRIRHTASLGNIWSCLPVRRGPLVRYCWNSMVSVNGQRRATLNRAYQSLCCKPLISTNFLYSGYSSA